MRFAATIARGSPCTESRYSVMTRKVGRLCNGSASTCGLPAGDQRALNDHAYAEVRDMKIHLRARLRTPGGEVRQDAELRPVEELAPLGRELARKMLEARG